MNIYGDTGNIIALKKRCELRGINVQVKNINPGDKLKKGECDLYFFGGGQDSSQISAARDLKTKESVLKAEIERGVPILAICGGYQLLGDYYQPSGGEKLKGVGIFPVYTEASNDRMIGNILIESKFGKLVGFENHSGKTYLKKGGNELGKVIKGFGNNGGDGFEGCLYKNSIGCYMHGSLLPKNPALADWLISKALEVKYDRKVELKPLNDELEERAHDFCVKRFG
jgi:lipid II isoglutaminyl synthase (glutamine-hydrolysing)